METSTAHVVPIMDALSHPKYTNYLPDELLLEVLSYIRPGRQSQGLLASFCLVSRQWYEIGIERLYEAPYIVGKAYDLFVRTVCPSVLTHIKRSELAGLVKILDLSHIVHQGNKSITARLLNRTKPSLLHFVAPQASFAINCWASLSKCVHLRVLNLSLVSECINYQSLNQTMRQLPELSELYLPRCTNNYGNMGLSMNVKWPPKLRHLQLSGSVHGKFMMDMRNQPENFPGTLTSLSIAYCPGLSAHDVRPLLENLSSRLTSITLRDLPSVNHGRFNKIMEWIPGLKRLTIALDYIGDNFGDMPEDFNSRMWESSKPLESLTLVTSGQQGDIDPSHAFTPVDLFTLIDERFLGRLRYVNIAASTGWANKDEAVQVDTLEYELQQLDKENWMNRRWHYKQLPSQYEGMTWRAWLQTDRGWNMRSKLRMLKDE